jgi:hypothetical protein
VKRDADAGSKAATVDTADVNSVDCSRFVYDTATLSRFDDDAELEELRERFVSPTLKAKGLCIRNPYLRQPMPHPRFVTRAWNGDAGNGDDADGDDAEGGDFEDLETGEVVGGSGRDAQCSDDEGDQQDDEEGDSDGEGGVLLSFLISRSALLLTSYRTLGETCGLCRQTVWRDVVDRKVRAKAISVPGESRTAFHRLRFHERCQRCRASPDPWPAGGGESSPWSVN